MRKTAESKERHECRLERLDTLKEVSERPFPADGIADQQCKKIDGFIAPEAPSDQANLLGKSLEQPFGRQVTGNHDDFSEPGRYGSTIKRRGLDPNTLIGYHG
jgi:hypothetical protein